MERVKSILRDSWNEYLQLEDDTIRGDANILEFVGGVLYIYFKTIFNLIISL